VGVNEITQTTANPLGDYLWGVYFGIHNFLEYFEQEFVKKSLRILKFFNIMLWFT